MDDSNAFAEYIHPELYDLENPDFEPEGSFYLSIARELGGSALELGCGTGRMTIPLAQNGIEITGVDIVPEMLALARTKAGDLPIRWIKADVRDFHLEQKFDLIFESGSVFMHMLTNADQQAFLDRVCDHLSPRGRFVVCLRFPHPDNLLSEAEEKEWFSYQNEQGDTIRVSGMEWYDEVRQVIQETAIRRITHPDGSEKIYTAPLCLRYTFPQEMERILAGAGFDVLERYGGPDRSPLTNDSPFMVYVCELKQDGPV